MILLKSNAFKIIQVVFHFISCFTAILFKNNNRNVFIKKFHKIYLVHSFKKYLLHIIKFDGLVNTYEII